MQAGIAASASAAIAAGTRAGQDAEPKAEGSPSPGRLRQSVCAWCYGGMKLEDLCAMAKRVGIGSIELLDEAQWKTVQSQGLACAVANGPGGITKGWNRVEHHDELVRRSEGVNKSRSP